MKTKITKESRNLLIAMLLGDGTISNNYVYKLAHCAAQKEYLEWKIALLKNHGIKTNGLKSYIKTQGYTIDVPVYYTQCSIIPFIKVLRRVFYKPKKNYGNRKLLNRLDAQGLAIWYMDDGHLNIQATSKTYDKMYLKISLCESPEIVQTVIDYFKEEWDISFYRFSEGKKTYSICCGTKEAKKFIQIIKPIVQQIPSMLYKINWEDKLGKSFQGRRKLKHKEDLSPKI